MFSNVVVSRNYKDEVYLRKAGGRIPGTRSTVRWPLNALSVEVAEDGTGATDDDDGIFVV
jgi:hypothetical protein